MSRAAAHELLDGRGLLIEVPGNVFDTVTQTVMQWSHGT